MNGGGNYALRNFGSGSFLPIVEIQGTMTKKNADGEFDLSKIDFQLTNTANLNIMTGSIRLIFCPNDLLTSVYLRLIN